MMDDYLYIGRPRRATSIPAYYGSTSSVVSSVPSYSLRSRSRYYSPNYRYPSYRSSSYSRYSTSRPHYGPYYGHRYSHDDSLLRYTPFDLGYSYGLRGALDSIGMKMAQFAALDQNRRNQPSPSAISMENKYQQILYQLPPLSSKYRHDRGVNRAYDPPFTVRSDVATNSRMNINRIMSRCR